VLRLLRLLWRGRGDGRVTHPLLLLLLLLLHLYRGHARGPHLLLLLLGRRLRRARPPQSCGYRPYRAGKTVCLLLLMLLLLHVWEGTQGFLLEAQRLQAYSRRPACCWQAHVAGPHGQQ
jgi:hypothetical protein